MTTTTPDQVWLAAQLTIVLFIVWRFLADGFASLSRLANALEERLPPWCRWSRWGDPITWLHHALWTAAVGALGAAITLVLLHDWRPGFQRFSLAWLGFYVVREAAGLWVARGTPGALRRSGPPPRVGWLVDGVFDVVFPALVVWAAYR